MTCAPVSSAPCDCLAKGPVPDQSAAVLRNSRSTVRQLHVASGKTCGQGDYSFHIDLAARDRGDHSTHGPGKRGIPPLYRYRHGSHFSLC
jgi:hypothetical protein